MHSAALPPGATFDPGALAQPGDAVASYLSRFPLAPLGIEDVALGEAVNRILARDAVSDGPLPADPRSTMDGFAVRSSDGGRPRRIVGEVRMGRAPEASLEPGEAVRIPTGGVLPEGADAVVPIEDADVVGDELRVRDVVEARAFFTARGEDITAGEHVLAAGRRLGGPELGVLATLGIVRVPVFRRPRVALISTGDELVAAAAAPDRGQIRDSNRWALAGALRAFGCEPVHLDAASDDPDAMRERLREASLLTDAVLLSGGSSVGAHDLTPDVIDSLGEPGVLVHGIKVKPGKPTVFAGIGRVPILGLPGNPTSSLMILEAIMAPILTALTGERGYRAARIATTAARPFRTAPGWTWYVPAEVGIDGAAPLALRSSHVSLLARAHGYVVVGPEYGGLLAAGERMEVVRFSSGGRTFA